MGKKVEKGLINTILNYDALTGLKQLESESVDIALTSPPYYKLRTYGVGMIWDAEPNCEHEWVEHDVFLASENRHGQSGGTCSPRPNQKKKTGIKDRTCVKCNAWKGELGQEPTFDLYIEHLIQIFREVRRVLKKTGTCFVVISDTYNGEKKGYTYGQYADGRKDKRQVTKGDNGIYKQDIHKMQQVGIPVKSLLLIPQRFAVAMSNDGWGVRQIPIWWKRNARPESPRDRWVIDFESVIFCFKSPKYYFKRQYEPYSEATIKEFGQIYTGQGQKDYKGAGVQNPSDVKRSIIKSMSKYPDGCVNEKSRITTRARSRVLAQLYWPDDIKAQKQFIREVHEHGSPVLKNMPPIGGLKKAGGANPTYSGNTPPWNGHGRIARAVWSINTQPSKIKHYAIFPERLVRKILNPACPPGGVVLDCFAGPCTTAVVAHKMDLNWIMIEPSAEYCSYGQQRLDAMVSYLLKNK